MFGLKVVACVNSKCDLNKKGKCKATLVEINNSARCSSYSRLIKDKVVNKDE